MRTSLRQGLMEAGIGLMLLTACTARYASPAPQHAHAPTAPAARPQADLAAFVPAGGHPGRVARGDADGDGDEDAAIVIQREGAERQPRLLRLLRRDADGHLEVAVDSPRAIPCGRCGGMAGDPLEDLRIGNGALTLRLAGGSRELWSSEFRFEYGRGDWRLMGVTHRGLDRATGKAVARTLAADEIGDVSLAAFDAGDFPADALP